jgi:HNH endonuclease
MDSRSDVVWASIPSHQQYEVSTTGLIRRKSDGFEVGIYRHNGYVYCRLSRPRVLARVHRLVAAAFIPNPLHLPVVNHLDSDPYNNSVDNLEWTTQAGNLEHAVKAGRMNRRNRAGLRSPMALFSDEEAQRIRDEYAAGGVSHMALAHRFGASKRTIGRIIAGKCHA